MAGNQAIAEGLPIFRVSAILAGVTPANSLQGGFQIDTLQQGAEVWVDDEKALFRWEEGSTATNDDVNVVTPTGVTGAGRFIRVGSSADVWGAGIVRGDTLADINALPAFSATNALIRGLVAADDETGGIFEIGSGGLTADGFDIIDLSGVHVPKQLIRISSTPANMLWANTESTATALVVNTPTFVGTDHIGIGAGPFINVNNEQWEWDGPETRLQVSLALQCTGTAGDRIWADMAAVTGGPVMTGTIGSVVDAAGNLQINGTLVLNSPKGTRFQLAFENRTGGNAVTLVVSLISIVRVWSNNNTVFV